MDCTCSSGQWSGRLLDLSAELARAETVETAADRAVELAEAAFDDPEVRVCEYDPGADTCTTIGPPARSPDRTEGGPGELPEPVVERASERMNGRSADSTSEAVVDTDPGGPLRAEALVPVGHGRVFRVGTTEPDGFDEPGMAAVEGIAANLETALRRLDGAAERGRTAERAEDDATAHRRLNELTIDPDEAAVTIERLLSLGCEYLGLDTGILSCVDDEEYRVEHVVDATGSHEAGAVYDFEETLCQAMLTDDRTDSLAFADVADTDHRNHPAADAVCAYVAAPVVVDGETYGTVNFSMATPRAEPFRPAEQKFVTRISEWIGREIERHRRLDQLEQYETVLEAVDDPVYALDTDGRFTFVNPAAEREFGYGEEVIGEHVSVGMDEADIERIQGQIRGLLDTDRRSTTAEFELRTGDGKRRTVENRLVLIGDGEFDGTAGVLRDITARRERERELESFQQAVEEAADGVAVLEDGEYVYVDRTHVDMYGFDTEDDLLGESWQKLYDDDEVARLEADVFPVLESDGHWRGMVTGSRPDGSTFPAELSLTIIDDGRLVCTVRDETERRARERELELKERAMDEATVGIQITDPTREDNPLVYVNDGFERMTGYTSEEVTGQNPRFLQGADTDPEQVTRLREAISAEEPVSLELENRRKDGTPYWSRISVTPVTDEDGTVTNYVGIQQDVTERRDREREAEKRVELLERMYEVTTDPEMRFEEKVTGLLEAGSDHLDLPYGFLTRIDRDDDSTAGTQRIIEAVGSHERLQQGESGPLSETYCQRTIDHEGTLALTNAAESGLVDDLSYETFGLDAYIGGNVRVGDGLYGTLCFASSEPRDGSFGQFERSLVSLLGQWIGYEIERRDAREELQQQQEQLELTLSGTNTGITEWNLETDELNSDDTFVDLVGRDADTAEEYFERVIHPDDSERVREALEADLAAREPTKTEYRVQTDDEDTRWVQSRAIPTYDDEGDPVSVLAIATDITDRKAREQELELKERAMNEANVGITISDPDREDNPLIYVNDGFVDQTGYTRRDVLDRNCRFLQADDSDQPALDTLRDAIAAEEPTSVELRNYRKNGEQFWNRLSVTPVYDEGGALANYIGIQQDVTDEKDREQRLRGLHRTTRELLEADNEDEAVGKALDTLADELDFHFAGGYLREGDELVQTGTVGPTTEADPDRIERGRTPLWDAIDAGGSVVIDDYSALDDGIERGDVSKGAYVPIGDHGVLVVGAADGTRLDGSEQRLVEILAGNLAAVLDSIERESSLRTSRKRYRSLAENVPNGAVLTFDDDLEYVLAAGELMSAFDLEEADISGKRAGTVFGDAEHELIPRFRAALDGERTDRRIELRDRTLRVHIVPMDTGEGASTVNRGLLLAQDITVDANRERELFEEREQFRLLTETIDEYAFLTVDEDGSVQTWNAGAEALFGYDADTALGMSVSELHPESDQESNHPERLMQQARIAGESADEGRRVRADGSEFHADIRYARLESDDGEFRGYATVVRDMTERRRQQRRTERFVEEANDVVTIVDTEGTIEYASGSADRILGYDPDDLVGENLFDRLHPKSREGAMKTFFTGIEEPDADLQVNCRIRSGNGGWLNVEGHCRNMLDDDAVGGMLLYLRDVTDSTERSRRFESIFNQTYQFTGLLEPDGTVIEANDAAREFAGLERGELVGSVLYELPWLTHSESVRDNARNAIERAANGEFVRYETEAHGGEGLATIDFSVKPVRDEDDEVSLLVAEGRDITDTQRRRRHLDVMQRLMRHNMRNDLGKVRGWAQMLSEESDPEARAEQFETIEPILDRWEEMIEKMKEIDRVLQPGADDGAKTESGSLIEEAVGPVRREHDDATILTEVPDAGTGEVPAPLAKAVRELVGNAAAASEDATIEVELASHDGDWIEIAVSDDGPGMPEMEAEVLETGEESPLSHGQGLGLWMVRMIVTQNGGDVSVESTADGTEVRLRVPRA